jgi:hypothetical protein
MIDEVKAIYIDAIRCILKDFIVLKERFQVKSTLLENITQNIIKRSPFWGKAQHLNLSNHLFDDYQWNLHQLKPLNKQISHKTFNSA